MKNVILICTIYYFAFLSIVSVCAQAPRMLPVESPVVHPDKTVTFNFKAQEAKKVELSCQFIKGSQALVKDSTGIWSITLGPVEPNIYPYNFVVDGTSVSDPGNLNIFPNERFKASLLEVPGDKTVNYSLQDVPHGDVTYCYYQSKTLKFIRH